MLTDAFKHPELVINTKFRSDGRLFNMSLLSVTKVKETVLRDFFFADDRSRKMQAEMHSFSEACINFGLTISTKRQR